MSATEIKDRLLDWHSTLAGILIAAITAVVVLLYCHVITAAQIVNCVDAATKALAATAAVASAFALMLTKSGNVDAAAIGENMLNAASEMKAVSALGDNLSLSGDAAKEQ